jgi:AGCS family alanine or glycine:cation symporter
VQEVVDTINGLIWSEALIYLALGAGLFFSLLTRFVQVRLFREMIHLLFSSKESAQGISSFQALSVSLSGRVGTGNIAGVAAAIGFGGPGAVFWMWVVAFLGAATAYIESALGQIYKEEDEGQYRGGPAYYIEKALGQKWYAWIDDYRCRPAAAGRAIKQHWQRCRTRVWCRTVAGNFAGRN